MKNVDLGCGISMRGSGKRFGTIGGFVRENRLLFKARICILTGEHVLEARKTMSRIDPFASTKISFVSPGCGARAARILPKFNQNNKELKLVELLDCLLSHCSNSVLKTSLNVPWSNDIT